MTLSTCIYIFVNDIFASQRTNIICSLYYYLQSKLSCQSTHRVWELTIVKDSNESTTTSTTQDDNDWIFYRLVFFFNPSDFRRKHTLQPFPIPPRQGVLPTSVPQVFGVCVGSTMTATKLVQFFSGTKKIISTARMEIYRRKNTSSRNSEEEEKILSCCWFVYLSCFAGIWKNNNEKKVCKNALCCCFSCHGIIVIILCRTMIGQAY